MRTVTNALMFLVALLTIVGLYLLLREQSSGGLHTTLAALLGNTRPAAKVPITPKVEPAKAPRTRGVTGESAIPAVEVRMVAIPVRPRPTTDAIQVGMAKSMLWEGFGKPDAVTASRDGERFLETLIYLLEDPAKAVVVRLVNGTVVSVRSTKTISPPILVPQTSDPRMLVSLQPGT